MVILLRQKSQYMLNIPTWEYLPVKKQGNICLNIQCYSLYDNTNNCNKKAAPVSAQEISYAL